MKASHALTVEDLRILARSRAPRVIMDWIEEGAGDEEAVRDNAASFLKYRFAPRCLRDVSDRTQSAELFGTHFASPFGFSPTGMQGLVRCGGEATMAAAAKQANIPYVLSGLTTTQLEKVAEAAPGNVWYQPYPTRDQRIVDDMIKRAEQAGISTLVVTADLPVEGKRLRSMRHRRNGRPNLSVYLDVMRHPAWLASFLWNQPRIEDLVQYARPSAKRKDLDDLFHDEYTTIRDKQTWSELALRREAWKGKLVVKGILSPEDAIHALELGVDAIIVSNHGGRQLERAPAPLAVFPAIHEAVGSRIPLMLDGGVRRGSDILTALCLGARFVFLGRPFLYGLAADGRKGVDAVIDILRTDIDTIMGQIGATQISDLGPESLAHFENDTPPPSGAAASVRLAG